MSYKKQLQEIMHAAGFVLHRTGKHLVWKKGKAAVVTSSTPSDCQAIKQILRDIRKSEI